MKNYGHAGLMDALLKALYILAIKPYDTKASLARYMWLIGKYGVCSTPTFVFVYSPTDIRKYSGSEPVKKGMAELMQSLSAR